MTYDRWAAQDDGDMERRHRPGWEQAIRLIRETDLSRERVLDFGCHQGGFLRLLYERKPFLSACGIDLGRDSIAAAREKQGTLPIRYEVTGHPEALGETFTMGFALSVLYLIADLPAHARLIRKSLAAGAPYYATYTDRRGRPGEAAFLQHIRSISPLAPQRHTLDDIADAFEAEHFTVSARRLIPDDFIDIPPGGGNEGTRRDFLDIRYEAMWLFRMVKQ